MTKNQFTNEEENHSLPEIESTSPKMENSEGPVKIPYSSTILRITLREMIWIVGGALISIIIVLSILFYVSGKSAAEEDRELNKALVKELTKINENQLKVNHALVSQVTYGKSRQRTVLFIRDLIYEYWESNKEAYPSGSIDKAFTIAKNNVEVTEMFPEIDPLFITALQFQESRWGIHRESPVGAQGLNHIMPTTGRLLAAAMGRSYSPEMILDDRISTEMAGKYINNAYAEYQDWELVLAEYNGGPRAAAAHRRNDGSLNAETKDYIAKVTQYWENLKEGHKVYNPNLTKIIKGGT